MTHREQTSRISAASVFTVKRRSRQKQADKARAKSTPACLYQIDRGLTGTHSNTAISAAAFTAADDHQALPQISGSEHIVRPEDCFPAGKRNLTARGT
jgi:hypothetical protein